MSLRRESVLREMGLGPLWRLRARDQAAAGETVQEAPPAEELRTRGGEWTPPAEAVQQARISVPEAPTVQARPETPAPRALREFTPPTRERTAQEPTTPPIDPERARRIATLEWDALEADMAACRACALCEKRRQAVPGVGDRQADWMFVGEGPGAEEDQRGEPFVGAAGKLLDAMLGAIGLKRGENVYIANAVKCRPPLNRTPLGDEIASCRPYLMRQIELVRPRLLVALGRPAALALLDAEIAIGASRGKAFHCGDTPVVVTYHPAYLLRNQPDKAKAWEDLCFARRLMEGGGPAR